MYDFILEGLKVGINRSASTRLAMAANHKDQSTSKNGVDHFTLTQDEYDKSMLFLGELLTIKDYIPRGLSHAFVGAYMRAKACANFSYDVFIHKMKVDPKCFDRCRLMIDYVEKIEEVYNCRNNNKISINRDKIKTR